MEIPTESRPLVRKEVRYLKRLLPFCKAVGWKQSHTGDREVTDSIVVASSNDCLHVRLDPGTSWEIADRRRIDDDEDPESIGEEMWLEAAGAKAERLAEGQNPRADGSP